ncbi:MAG: DNA starvation/stationary phase protection protein [Bryobacteraceae bacterium]|nr:DNA starvation/stationary phase protection protein [Bryobacteraceae bacterium]
MIVTSRRPNQGLTEDQQESVVQMLNRLLSDEFVLYTKTRNYHWNVVGPRFHSLHEMFEEQYEELEEFIDEIAERARMNGGRSYGALGEFLRETRLHEQPGDVPDADRMVENLLNDHETVIRQMRADIKRCDEELNSVDTSNFLTDLLEKHQKMAWMLRSTLEH